VSAEVSVVTDLVLSDEDKTHLETLIPKHQLIRDRVRGVVKSLSTGFYLWGEGGTSKSYTVLDELQKQRADYVLHNSRMTGRGLVDTLEKFPTSIHIIEDCESIFDDKKAWGVLRSALWSQSRKRPPEREVSWTAHRVDIRFLFTGGIILIANRSLDDLPELRALKNRITTLQLVATFNEISALMRSVALEGFTFGQDYLTPKECLTVAEFVIDRMRSLARHLDMRIYINGVKDFLQHKTGHSDTEWQELIETRLNEITLLRERREDMKSREAAIALEISRMEIPQKEKLKLWKERTKKSERAYWRRLKSLE
jgi:hypothetical protein